MNQNLVNLKINNKNYVVESGITLIQACSIVGIEIPRFCYHEKLTIAGNCRMCLVEISQPKSIKPAASCALPVNNNMHIHTNTTMVKKARESVLEFLLINHPLDCPICDQGGECDLQDQTIVFGNDRGRFYDDKRAVKNKTCGPLIKTIMTRCIHCTRCVRFGSEIAGVDFLGTTGRGVRTEISQYISKILDSELSGNIIDLCPVGALTSKLYAYKARPWELNSVETIDILDSVGSNIRVDFRGLEILRILPRLNENVNEEWITDKTRFSFDGIAVRRLQSPLIKLNRKFIPVSWEIAFSWIGFQLTIRNVTNYIGVIGALVDAETIVVLKDFLSKMGRSFFMVENIKNLAVDFRYNYLLNIPLAALENLDLCVLVGFNPRLELPLLNTRIRKAVKIHNCAVYNYGYMFKLTYTYQTLSNQTASFLKFLEGRSALCSKFLKAKNPCILIGNSILGRVDSKNFISAIFNTFLKIFENKTYTMNLILTNMGAVNALELGAIKTPFNTMLNGYNKLHQLYYLVGVSDFKFFSKQTYNIGKTFKIYQGHTGNLQTDLVDVVLPGCTFFESKGSFLNLEGRIQHTQFVKTPPGFCRVDWKIINILSIFMGYPLSYQTLQGLRERLFKISPLFNSKLKIMKNLNFKPLILKNESFKIFNNSFMSPFYDYYINNPLSNVSPTMNKVSFDFIKNQNFNNIN